MAFYYYYKKKIVGPYEKEPDRNYKIGIMKLINAGILDEMPDQDIFPDADPEDFITITNDEETKRQLGL